MIAKHRGRPPRADARPELSLSADVCHSNAARGISDLTVIWDAIWSPSGQLQDELTKISVLLSFFWKVMIDDNFKHSLSAIYELMT